MAWSNALQARTRAGEVYLLGPSSRVTLNADRLHPLAGAALDRLGLAEQIRPNPLLEHCRAGGRARPRNGRGDRHRRRLRPARAAGGRVAATRRCSGLGDRGAARPALPPLPDRRARADRSAQIVPPDQPEPGRDRGRPDLLCAVGAGPAACRGDPAAWSSSSAATTRASRAPRTSSTCAWRRSR